MESSPPKDKMKKEESQVGWKSDDQLFDSFLEKAGGLGRFQLFIVLAFFFAIDGINFIVYEMSYLELLPEKYLCTYPGSTEAVSCTPDDFCGQDSTVVSWQADFTDPDAYYNWNQKLDLACRSPSEVGLLGSVQFGGWVITLLFVPRLQT